MGIVKPLMKYITTIDFGQLTSEDDALAIFEASGLRTVSHEPIAGSLPPSVDNYYQLAYLTVLARGPGPSLGGAGPGAGPRVPGRCSPPAAPQALPHTKDGGAE